MTTKDELLVLLEEAMKKLSEASNALRESASPKEVDGIIGLRFVAEIISEDWPSMADACDNYTSQWENERNLAKAMEADLAALAGQNEQLIKAIGAKTFEEALELIAALKREVATWKGIAHDNNQLWLSAAKRADDLERKFVRPSKESDDSDLTTLKKLADLLFTLDQLDAWEKAVLISQRWEADRAILKLARELLERYEWQEDLHTGAQVCPVCRGGRPHHRKDCDIPTILGRNKP